MFSRAMVQVALSNEFIRQTTPEKLSVRGVTNPTELTEIGFYRAEARVLKCLAYYHLLDLFGKAPLVTENDPINFRGPQMDRTQLFDYIETQLLAVLPSLKDARTNESGRLDKAFAWAILSKMYLNSEVYTGTKRYQDCMDMCSNILAAGYQLKLNYLDNFKADNDTSSELIFAIESDGMKTQNYGATTVMCNGQVGSIEGNGQTLYGVNGWGGALRLRKQFVQKFDGSDFDYDSRKTIISSGRPIEISNVAIQAQGYVLGKWSNRSSSGLPGQNSTFVDTNFPLFRLADFYLMYAEAQMRKDGATNGSSIANSDATSLGYINALRERANDVGINFKLNDKLAKIFKTNHELIKLKDDLRDIIQSTNTQSGGSNLTNIYDNFTLLWKNITNEINYFTNTVQTGGNMNDMKDDLDNIIYKYTNLIEKEKKYINNIVGLDNKNILNEFNQFSKDLYNIITKLHHINSKLSNKTDDDTLDRIKKKINIYNSEYDSYANKLKNILKQVKKLTNNHRNIGGKRIGGMNEISISDDENELPGVYANQKKGNTSPKLIAQKLNIVSNKGFLWVGSYTDIFPSASLSVNGQQIMHYAQPSFVGTHSAPPIMSTYLPGQVQGYNFDYYPSKFFKR
jgi:hypothetical protein